jgi:hypothetical protein
MALDTATMKTAVKQLLTDMMTREENSIDEFAERLTGIVETFVKSGTVTVATGISVATTGTAAAQTGATTSTGTGKIS